MAHNGGKTRELSKDQEAACFNYMAQPISSFSWFSKGLQFQPKTRNERVLVAQAELELT